MGKNGVGSSAGFRLGNQLQSLLRPQPGQPPVAAVLVQALGSGACALISFALLAFLGRHLGADEFGRYVAILSGAALALIGMEAGGSTLLQRAAATRGQVASVVESIMSRAVVHVFASTVLGAAIAVLFGPVYGLAMAAALFCMGWVALGNLISGRMRGNGAFARESAWQLLCRLLSAGAIVTSVTLWEAQATEIFLAWALGLLLAWLVYGRRWTVMPSWRGLPAQYRIALPILLIEAASGMLFRGDMAVLGLMPVPDDQLSWYAACTRLTEAALLLFAPISNVLMHSFRQAVGQRAIFRARVVESLGLAATMGLAAVGISFGFGTALMSTIFGAEFSAAGTLLGPVSLALPFGLANLGMFAALIALDLERRLMLAVGGAAVMAVITLVAATWSQGVYGAAIGLACIQALLMLRCGYLLLGQLRLMPCG